MAWFLPLLYGLGAGVGAGLFSKMFGGDDDDDIPSALEPFWNSLVDLFFGTDGSPTFRKMLMDDLDFQKKQYDSYLQDTGKLTEEHRAKLQGYEDTYTNKPYTYGVSIGGQKIKVIPKRSLATINALTGLQTQRFGSGIKQEDRELAGGMKFTPNQGSMQYYEKLLKVLGSLPQQRKDPSANTFDWLQLMLSGYGAFKPPAQPTE